MASASFQVEQDKQGRPHVALHGQWSLRSLDNDFARLRRSLKPFFSNPETHWDLLQVEQLDTAGAAMLWHGWHGSYKRHGQLDKQAKLEGRINMTTEQAVLFAELDALNSNLQPEESIDWLAPAATIGGLILLFRFHLTDFLRLLGQLLLELAYTLRHPREFPVRELLANIYKSGVTALPVTGLVGFMIGVAMSYLMSGQLRVFGANIFIVNILGLSIIRELGPILMAVLIAGRSGSAMTAQIGVMRVTEEIDALTTMGISRVLRIVLPKVLGLTIVAPFLVLWTSSWGLIGGALSAFIELGLSFRFFFDYLPTVVQPVNLTLGMIKGILFGFVITLIACHFGLHVKANTESLSASTTSSVVASITSVILLDAAFAILTRKIGI